MHLRVILSEIKVLKSEYKTVMDFSPKSADFLTYCLYIGLLVPHRWQFIE